MKIEIDARAIATIGAAILLATLVSQCTSKDVTDDVQQVMIVEQETSVPDRWISCTIVDTTNPSKPITYENARIIATGASQGAKWIRFKTHNQHITLSGNHRIEYDFLKE